MKTYVAIFLLLAATSTAAAASEQQSFAAAISPEQAFAVCFAGDVPKAVACALDKCKAAGGEECVVTSACSDGWAGSMGVSTGEIHFTETVCGAPNEAAVVTSLRAFCKGSLPYAQQCFLASIWSSDGKEKKLEKEIDPKKIK